MFATKNDLKLKPSEQARYDDLFDKLSEPILLIHPETFEILEHNVASESFFGKTSNELVLLDFIQFFKENEQDLYKKHFRSIARKYNTKRLECEIVINNKIKYIELTLCSLDLNRGNKCIQIILKDITENKELHRKLEMLSITDGLTSLYNKRYFEETMKIELERSMRDNNPFSLILLDIDNFKKYNDTNGHVEGDNLLIDFAKEIKNNVRNIDIACRYGGEEFVIICPNTDLNDALMVAERLKESILKKSFKHGEKQPLGFLSASMGVSNYPYHLKEKWENRSLEDKDLFLKKCITELKEKSDQGLYNAKELGRNRVVSIPS